MPPVTRPPRIFPLLPIAFVALVVGDRALAIFYTLAFLVELDTDDPLGRHLPGLEDSLAGALAMDLAVFVLASLLLRWLVRRWIRSGAAA